MPIFEKPPLDTLSFARERWTPIYLEHGRLEVDDSSIKWIGADYTVLRIPVATVSVLMLGPGTSVTHAAIKVCADCNTPICWVGEEGIRFYSFGVTPTYNNLHARKQAKLHASKKAREQIARKMFAMRFGSSEDIKGKTINELMSMEGARIRALYENTGKKYGVTWRGRNYNPDNWHLADNINRAISAANASLYALVTAVVCSMGFMPQLGFIHSSGTLPFVFDIADIYKPENTLEAAFETVSINPKADEKEVISRLKFFIEKNSLLKRMPKDLYQILDIKGENTEELL